MSATRIIKFVFIFLLVFFIAFILVQNKDEVTVKILFYRVTLPLSYVMFLSFIIGFMFAAFYGIFEMIRQGGKYKRMEKENRLLKQEVSNLRKEPLLDDSLMEESKNEEEGDNPSYETPLDEETLNKIR